MAKIDELMQIFTHLFVGYTSFYYLCTVLSVERTVKKLSAIRVYELRSRLKTTAK